MGHLIYGVAPAIRIDDRALEHLRVVILQKLRRDESFSFNWDNEPDVQGDDAIATPGLHGTVWISKHSSLYFSFDTTPWAPLNRAWLEAINDTASSPSGLRLIPEPEGAAPDRASDLDRR